ncbi:aminotransferase class I/II-fold pyridoxal phosphate-dependent enzyme [Pseudomonas sp. KU43P]|uniref:aminotransferase class I/II-fold pyridoxal phosphate-dependent enzyme n=1 Tax=Pseudomonas sp. KU43P TaxID=2487887 RepID=UPI0012AA10FA|nr:PLP-dependent aminotransferase family protein [Pseudomonas sp. KU43P]BBH46451.1 transcriptional regulator [Pseudomonas sp. KU43P]
MGREFAYHKVYRYLQALIDQAERGGELRLPSLRALARRLRVSLATVQAAYGLLENEGRVRSVAKSGYFAQLSVGTGEARMPRSAEPVQPNLERTLLAHERRLARQRVQAMPPCSASVRLREALADRYARAGGQLWKTEHVHLGPDVQAVLETLLAALALQGGTILVASPCCWRLLRVLQRLGMQVLEVPLDSEGGFDLGSLAQLLGQGSVRMLIMPSCLGLPGGGMISAYDQQQVARLLEGQPIWLLENDLDSERRFAASSGARLRDRVDPRWLLVLGSLEAAVGAEAPYAYVLGRHPVLGEAFARRAFQLPPLRQQALAQMFSKGEIDRHLSRQRVVLGQRMRQLCDQLDAHLGGQLVFTVPEGGHAVWVRLRRPALADRVVAAMAGTALAVMAGAQFSLQGRYRHCLLLTWTGEQPSALREAVFRLGEALAVHGAKRAADEA